MKKKIFYNLKFTSTDWDTHERQLSGSSQIILKIFTDEDNHTHLVRLNREWIPVETMDMDFRDSFDIRYIKSIEVEKKEVMV